VGANRQRAFCCGYRRSDATAFRLSFLQSKGCRSAVVPSRCPRLTRPPSIARLFYHVENKSVNFLKLSQGLARLFGSASSGAPVFALFSALSCFCLVLGIYSLFARKRVARQSGREPTFLLPPVG